MAKSSLHSKLSDALRGARADVDALRDCRLSIIEQREAVLASPATPAEISRRVDAVLDDAEASVREWSSFSTLASATPHPFDLDSAIKRSPLGVLSLLGLRDTVRGKLIGEAIAAAPGKAMDAAVREAELAKLEGELADVERAEERAIREAEEAGAQMSRRADADPAVYLADEV